MPIRILVLVQDVPAGQSVAVRRGDSHQSSTFPFISSFILFCPPHEHLSPERINEGQP